MLQYLILNHKTLYDSSAQDLQWDSADFTQKSSDKKNGLLNSYENNNQTKVRFQVHLKLSLTLFDVSLERKTIL